MFLAMYESRKVVFNDGAVWVTRIPVAPGYAASDDNSDGEYTGFGDTPLAAIADMVANSDD